MIEMIRCENCRDVQAWKPIIEVAAVNCADDKNSRVCREHAIDAFPTIKVIHRISLSQFFYFFMCLLLF